MKKKVVFGLPGLFAALALVFVGCSNYEHPSYTTAKAVGISGTFTGTAIDGTRVMVKCGPDAFDGTEDANGDTAAAGKAASNAFLMVAATDSSSVALYLYDLQNGITYTGSPIVLLFLQSTVGADNKTLYVDTKNAKLVKSTDTSIAAAIMAKWATASNDFSKISADSLKYMTQTEFKDDTNWGKLMENIPAQMSYEWKDGKLELSAPSGTALGLVSPMTLTKQ
jgi:hypothetical protein